VPPFRHSSQRLPAPFRRSPRNGMRTDSRFQDRSRHSGPIGSSAGPRAPTTLPVAPNASAVKFWDANAAANWNEQATSLAARQTVNVRRLYVYLSLAQLRPAEAAGTIRPRGGRQGHGGRPRRRRDPLTFDRFRQDGAVARAGGNSACEFRGWEALKRRPMTILRLTAQDDTRGGRLSVTSSSFADGVELVDQHRQVTVGVHRDVKSGAEVDVTDPALAN